MSFFSDKARDDCWTYFERHIKQIPGSANQDAARTYLQEREENIEISTVGSYLTHIKAFGQYLNGRDWKDATRSDVINHIKSARGRQGRQDRGDVRRTRSLGRYTKYQRMVMLREFYKWLLDTDEDETPPQFKRMPFRKPSLEEQTRSRDDRLTIKEVVDMLAAARNEKERCIVMLLLDSGFRAGELVALDIGDVRFDEHGAKVLHGRDARGLKTRRRRVPTRITFAAPYVRRWVAVHPRRMQPDAPLFPSRSNRNNGQGLTVSPSRLRAQWRIRPMRRRPLGIPSLVRPTPTIGGRLEGKLLA